MKWWQERVVYQIYPRSFQDTNGDGIGDIPGIISHLDDLVKLGIGTIWLSPVYPSPNIDNGYDISDYCAIHPDFGTMDDMDILIKEARRRNIRIVMDLVINHTSNMHPWFLASRNKDSEYRDWYVWKPGKGEGVRPNNWTSFFGEDCWEYDEQSGEYYLHLFAKQQPDLNWRNPKVLTAIENILRFWLDKGVSGFRCDVINLLYKDSLEDGKKKLILTGSEHYLTKEGTHEILKKLRLDVFKGYECFTVGETVFVTPEEGRALCLPEREELDMIFSFEHMETDQFLVKWFKRRFNAGRFFEAIIRWQDALPWNAIYFENHDQPRSVSRFGNDKAFWAESAKLLSVMLLSLRGTPFMYQGQEIGMTNFDFTGMESIKDIDSHNIYKKLKDMHFPARLRWYMMRKTSRDNARTPMQWSSAKNAGFTSGNPWIQVNSNYKHINLAAQLQDKNSVWSFWRKMIALRLGSRVLSEGSFVALRCTRTILAYRRAFDGESLTVLLNFSGRTKKVACLGEVLISNYGRHFFDGKLKPWEAIVMRVGKVLTPEPLSERIKSVSPVGGELLWMADTRKEKHE